MKHPNIIKIEEAFRNNKEIYIVMELAYGGSLFDMIENSEEEVWSEEFILKIALDICSAIKCLHDNDIVHRDLKI